MKFGQLIKYDVRKFFFKNHAQNEGGRRVPDLHLFFKKATHGVKANSQHLSFNIFWYVLTLMQ